jgi:phosphatidylserine/phosphatidylglycerophosphate/cardiolipin synthase-like enzyme
MAELEQARLKERLATVNANIFKTARDIKRDVPAAQYYETLMNDLAKTRAQVARLEKELPAKDQADVSRVDIEGLKVHICSLVAPNSPPDNWMDVYVHSKLMIVDDVFTTLGSANVNTRSMQVDSELNICIEDPAVTRPLREHLFGMHAGAATGEEVSKTYIKWKEIIVQNNSARAKNLTVEGALMPSSPIAALVEFLQSSPVKKNLD